MLLIKENKMELLNAIYERRSIRKYAKVQIPLDHIEKMVRSAQMAPSWKNSQTARFYVAHTEKAIEEMRDCLASFNKERTENVGAFIVTTVKKGISGYVNGEPTHLGNGFECFDNGLSVQNLLLTATELGYGTLIMGLYKPEKIKTLFQIPDSEDVVVVIALGKADVSPDAPQRNSLDQILTIK